MGRDTSSSSVLGHRIKGGTQEELRGTNSKSRWLNTYAWKRISCGRPTATRAEQDGQDSRGWAGCWEELEAPLCSYYSIPTQAQYLTM